MLKIVWKKRDIVNQTNFDELNYKILSSYETDFSRF